MPLDVHATEEEDKLVVLSSLNRLGGCTEEQLLRFLVENALMNQFQFYLALGGLKEAGFIREARHLEGTLLILTPQGRESDGNVRFPHPRFSNGEAERERARMEASHPRRAANARLVAGDGQRLRRYAARAGGRRGNLLHDADGGDEGAGEALLQRWPSRAPFLYQTIMEQLGEAESEEKKFVKPAKKQKKKTKSKKTETFDGNGKRGA